MAGTEDPAAAVARAAHVDGVRTVAAVRVAEQTGGRLLVGVRVGLPPTLQLTDVVTVIAHVQVSVARALGRPADVAVEPSVASDATTPTETIVIRARE